MTHELKAALGPPTPSLVVSSPKNEYFFLGFHHESHHAAHAAVVGAQLASSLQDVRSLQTGMRKDVNRVQGGQARDDGPAVWHGVLVHSAAGCRRRRLHFRPGLLQARSRALQIDRACEKC